MFERTILLALAVILSGPVGCVTLSTPGAGVAHTDVEYCAQLIEIYSRYLSGDELGARRNAASPDLDGRVAVSRCQQGDTASGIPVLERKLLANGFSLPKRA